MSVIVSVCSRRIYVSTCDLYFPRDCLLKLIYIRLLTRIRKKRKKNGNRCSIC